MATSKATAQARKVRFVVAQTGVTEREAIAALEAEEWLETEAVLSIRAEFTANLRQREARTNPTG